MATSHSSRGNKPAAIPTGQFRGSAGDSVGVSVVGTLLVVDDDPRVLRTLRRLLLCEGYTVLSAGDARSALSLVDEETDLMLLDLRLPDGDGLDVCRRLRARGYTFPIIAVTARAETDECQAAAEAGLTDYVAKPFDPADLLDRVRGHLPRQGATAE